MYLSVGTRPDITFYVSQLSQYSKDPKVIHLTALKRIYRYLKGTKSYKLCFVRIRGKIEVFTDASWSSTKDSKSFSGYLTKLGSLLLSWKSQKQPLVALSTCEAELMAICEGTKELKWFMNFLSEIGHQSCVEIPLVLKTDNEVSKGNLRISFVNSEAQEADLLTKRLPGDRIQRLLKVAHIQPHLELVEIVSDREVLSVRARAVWTWLIIQQGESEVLILHVLREVPEVPPVAAEQQGKDRLRVCHRFSREKSLSQVQPVI
ncbi:hypothetical protein LAZ67_X000609 [Cordylochernes scorpioides]|uniref:Uncharacterized protein n=1 Tax=Cordylochernes scorpioides TaxID=51811 RepID=A0ABY6LSU6_9ARAC|nr:hypothetical protein LAZ67_X000609 [Cordylochernes scorpioides]